jgi:hypothetical protein
LRFGAGAAIYRAIRAAANTEQPARGHVDGERDSTGKANMATAPNDYAESDNDFGPDVEVTGSRRSGPAGFAGKSGLAGFAQSKLHGLIDDGRSELVKSLDSLVYMVEGLAGKVGVRQGNPVAGFAHQAVDTIADIRDALRDRPIETLIDDGRDLVRRQPEIAMGVAVVAGFLTARLIKASQ